MHPFTRTCLDVFFPLGMNNATAASEIENAVRDELRHVSVTEEIIAYQGAFPLQDAAVSDYCNKLIGIPGIGELMTSLRFRNDDTNKPYIDILYSTFAPGLDNRMYAVREAISEAYQTSAPAFISFFVSGPVNDTWPFPATPAKGLYAANLDHPFPVLRNDGLSIIKASDSAFHERYLAEYAAFNAVSARNRLVSQPEDLGYLAELAANGSLFEIRVRGALAGVIAYDYLPALSVPGFEIVEAFLFGPYRGKGYAKYAQSMLIAQMQQHRLPGPQLMFGTIHTQNKASIGTAERNGRKLLGAWYEMPLR